MEYRCRNPYCETESGSKSFANETWLWNKRLSAGQCKNYQIDESYTLEATQESCDKYASALVENSSFVHPYGKWKLDQNQLKNQAGVTLNDKWLLPDGGEKGIISNRNSDKYLSI